MDKQRIDVFDGLKGIAFAGIFLLHIGSRVEWAAFGVSIFFVLSGFLMEYRHAHDEIIKGTLSFGVCSRYAVQHMKKAYPLHILTMMVAIVLYLFQKKGRIILIAKIILNITLMQSWVPSVGVNVSLNGVAWYLSSILFCYFVFPFLHSLNSGMSRKRRMLMATLVIVMQFLLSILAFLIDKEDDFYRWATYDAPFFRAGDFFVGIMLSSFIGDKCNYQKGSESKLNKLAVLYDAETVVLTTAFICWSTQYTHQSLPGRVIDNWTTVYIVISCAWIWGVFNEGIIRLIACNAVGVWIGRNSLYLFLIHYVVIKAVRLFTPSISNSVILMGLVSAIITVILSIVYKTGAERIRNLRRYSFPHRTV